MTASQRPVLSLGELLIDLIVADSSTGLEDVSTLSVLPGGAPANAAVAVARLGVPAAFCGVVGDDPFGRRLVRTLEDAGVDVSRVRATQDADTTLAFAWKDDRGNGHFRLLRMADILLSSSDIDRADLSNMASVIVGSVALSEEPSRSSIYHAVSLADQAGVPVCFDVNVRPTLWRDAQRAVEACEPVLERVQLLKLSLDDASYLLDGVGDVDDILSRIAQFPARFVVLTDGPRGSWFVDRESDGGIEFVPAFTVDAVEPTGAGDAFTAALIVRLWMRNWSALHRSDVEFASAAGAITATRRGAIDSLPTAEQVDEFMARYS